MTLVNLYPRIVSYKFLIKELVNDLNVYKNFIYFLIPKYLTNTRRIYLKSCYTKPLREQAIDLWYSEPCLTLDREPPISMLDFLD